MRSVSGPVTSAITGSPSSTTAASGGETVSSSPATTAYTTAEPTPGPTTVRACATVCTSPTPIVTTSPAPARRPSAAPSRTTWSTTTFTVRKLASIRTRVIVRCRMMLSQAFTAPTANITAVQAASTPSRPGTSPSSTARAIRYGCAASSTIHTLPSTAPATARPGCRRTSHHRYHQPPRVSGLPGSSYASIIHPPIGSASPGKPEGIQGGTGAPTNKRPLGGRPVARPVPLGEGAGLAGECGLSPGRGWRGPSSSRS